MPAPSPPPKQTACSGQTAVSASRLARMEALHRHDPGKPDFGTDWRSKPNTCAIAWPEHSTSGQVAVARCRMRKRCGGGGHRCWQANGTVAGNLVLPLLRTWGWTELQPWLQTRVDLPVGPLFCVLTGPTRGRLRSSAAARGNLRQAAAAAGVRRR